MLSLSTAINLISSKINLFHSINKYIIMQETKHSWHLKNILMVHCNVKIQKLVEILHFSLDKRPPWFVQVFQGIMNYPMTTNGECGLRINSRVNEDKKTYLVELGSSLDTRRLVAGTTIDSWDFNPFTFDSVRLSLFSWDSLFVTGCVFTMESVTKLLDSSPDFNALLSTLDTSCSLNLHFFHRLGFESVLMFSWLAVFLRESVLSSDFTGLFTGLEVVLLGGELLVDTGLLVGKLPWLLDDSETWQKNKRLNYVQTVLYYYLLTHYSDTVSLVYTNIF